MGTAEVTKLKEAGRPASKRSDLSPEGIGEISAGLRTLLADVFALYLKTKNFHWHITGPNFRDYHLLLDEQADQIFKMTDEIAERARKIGGAAVRFVGEVTRLQRIKDNDDEFVPPSEMLAELQSDNLRLTGFLRSSHELCARYNDVATASLIENWIDETERRTWFLSEVQAQI